MYNPVENPMAANDSSPHYDFSDSDIIGEIENTPEGKVLKPNGPCSIIYGHMERPGETYILTDDNDAIAVCYVDHDQNLEEMNFDKYGWHIGSDEAGTALTLIIHDLAGDGQTNLFFSFRQRDREAIRQMKRIKSDKMMTIYFISILYGELVKYKKQAYSIPETIIGRIPV